MPTSTKESRDTIISSVSDYVDSLAKFVKDATPVLLDGINITKDAYDRAEKIIAKAKVKKK
jgi:hypothetical protein